MIFAIVVGVIVAILFLAISFSFLGKEANKIVEKKGNDKKYDYSSVSPSLVTCNLSANNTTPVYRVSK